MKEYRNVTITIIAGSDAPVKSFSVRSKKDIDRALKEIASGSNK